MLKDAEIAEFRATLLAEKDALSRDESETADERGTVMLDQQSVGRLSRMDAMQRQSMAAAQSRRRQARGLRIEKALERIDEGEFGYCQDCGEDIAKARLEVDPTTPNCLSCARG